MDLRGSLTTGSPVSAYVPSSQPGVHVVSVAGRAVPERPGGDFTAADVTMTEGGPVVVEIRARRVPTGTVPTLHLSSLEGADQVVQASPLVGSLVRPLGGWLSDKLGGARVTQWSTWLMVAAAVGTALVVKEAGHAERPEEWFPAFLALFLALFVGSGIGNGSTFRMVPIIFKPHEAGPVLGWTAAVAAYGAFIVPKVFGPQIEARTPDSSGSPCRNRSRKRVGPVPSVARPVGIGSPSDRTTLASLAPWTIRLSEISGIDEDTGISNTSHGSTVLSLAVTGQGGADPAPGRWGEMLGRATAVPAYDRRRRPHDGQLRLRPGSKVQVKTTATTAGENET